MVTAAQHHVTVCSWCCVSGCGGRVLDFSRCDPFFYLFFLFFFKKTFFDIYIYVLLFKTFFQQKTFTFLTFLTFLTLLTFSNLVNLFKPFQTFSNLVNHVNLVNLFNLPEARSHSPTSSSEALKLDSKPSAWSHQSFADIMIFCSKSYQFCSACGQTAPPSVIIIIKAHCRFGVSGAYLLCIRRHASAALNSSTDWTRFRRLLFVIKANE